MKHYDAIIIGAGQAGTPLAKKLALSGKKTAIVEKRRVGGTCINDGCTPTKAMVASARAAHQARHASALGVETGTVKVNLKAIKKRKDEIVASFRESAQKGLEKTKNLDLIFGTASFSGKKELTIQLQDGKEEKLTADLIFINTGEKTAVPDVEGLKEINFLTSTSIMDLEEVPDHLVILGGNYIGLEFGQMFKRFGSKVTILEKSERIMMKEDADVAACMTEILEGEDITIATRAALRKVSERNGKISVEYDADGQSKKITCSHFLVATGRSPQTPELRLESAGVSTDKKGYIIVNKKLETNVNGIYALGDVKGGPAFTHIAYNDYTIVYRNLIEHTKYTTDDRPVPYCMFTDPQLGRIGLSEAEAKAQNLDYKVAILPMSNVARGIETGETLGMMKAIVDVKTKKIIGAAILAAEGGEVVSVLEMAIEGGITYDQIRYCVFAHPTYSEYLNNLFMQIEE